MTERRGLSSENSGYISGKVVNDFSPRKTMIVLVIVVGCFAVLWPKVFYPMLVGSANNRIKPSPIDRTQGCCDVISEKDVTTIKLMSEICNTIIEKTKNGPISNKELLEKCQSKVLETCGIDISAVLQEQVRLGHTTKQILAEIRSLNGSLCLKYNFGVSPWKLGVPHRITLKVSPSSSIRQERPLHLRSEMVHPAFRERGRAIPQAEPFSPTKPSPPSRVISKVVEGKPGPIPGMRPTIGGAGHVVPSSKHGGNSMGLIMPIYTVGIVVFFTYTVMKIVFKKQPEVLYPSVDPDPHFRREVFEADRGHLGTRTARTAKDGSSSKLGWKERDARDTEMEQLRQRLRETEQAMERIVEQMAKVPLQLQDVVANGKVISQEDDQGSVQVLGMETTASCEGGQKWTRPDSPVLLPSHSSTPSELTTPPQEIYLEGALPPQSHLLVTDSATEAQEVELEEDPAVVLAGKMTLSVISLDSTENVSDESSVSSKKNEDRSSSNVSDEFEKIDVAQLEQQIDDSLEVPFDQNRQEEDILGYTHIQEEFISQKQTIKEDNLDAKLDDNKEDELLKELEDNILKQQELLEIKQEPIVKQEIDQLTKEPARIEDNILLAAIHKQGSLDESVKESNLYDKDSGLQQLEDIISEQDNLIETSKTKQKEPSLNQIENLPLNDNLNQDNLKPKELNLLKKDMLDENSVETTSTSSTKEDENVTTLLEETTVYKQESNTDDALDLQDVTTSVQKGNEDEPFTLDSLEEKLILEEVNTPRHEIYKETTPKIVSIAHQKNDDIAGELQTTTSCEPPRDTSGNSSDIKVKIVGSSSCRPLTTPPEFSVSRTCIHNTKINVQSSTIKVNLSNENKVKENSLEPISSKDHRTHNCKFCSLGGNSKPECATKAYIKSTTCQGYHLPFTSLITIESLRRNPCNNPTCATRSNITTTLQNNDSNPPAVGHSTVKRVSQDNCPCFPYTEPLYQNRYRCPHTETLQEEAVINTSDVERESDTVLVGALEQNSNITVTQDNIISVPLKNSLSTTNQSCSYEVNTIGKEECVLEVRIPKKMHESLKKKSNSCDIKLVLVDETTSFHKSEDFGSQPSTSACIEVNRNNNIQLNKKETETEILIPSDKSNGSECDTSSNELNSELCKLNDSRVEEMNPEVNQNYLLPDVMRTKLQQKINVNEDVTSASNTVESMTEDQQTNLNFLQKYEQLCFSKKLKDEIKDKENSLALTNQIKAEQEPEQCVTSRQLEIMLDPTYVNKTTSFESNRLQKDVDSNNLTTIVETRTECQQTNPELRNKPIQSCCNEKYANTTIVDKNVDSNTKSTCFEYNYLQKDANLNTVTTTIESRTECQQTKPELLNKPIQSCCNEKSANTTIVEKNIDSNTTSTKGKTITESQQTSPELSNKPLQLCYNEKFVNTCGKRESEAANMVKPELTNKETNKACESVINLQKNDTSIDHTTVNKVSKSIDQQICPELLNKTSQSYSNEKSVNTGITKEFEENEDPSMLLNSIGNMATPKLHNQQTSKTCEFDQDVNTSGKLTENRNESNLVAYKRKDIKLFSIEQVSPKSSYSEFLEKMGMLHNENPYEVAVDENSLETSPSITESTTSEGDSDLTDKSQLSCTNSKVGLGLYVIPESEENLKEDTTSQSKITNTIMSPVINNKTVFKTENEVPQITNKTLDQFTCFVPDMNKADKSLIESQVFYSRVISTSPGGSTGSSMSKYNSCTKSSTQRYKATVQSKQSKSSKVGSVSSKNLQGEQDVLPNKKNKLYICSRNRCQLQNKIASGASSRTSNKINLHKSKICRNEEVRPSLAKRIIKSSIAVHNQSRPVKQKRKKTDYIAEKKNNKINLSNLTLTEIIKIGGIGTLITKYLAQKKFYSPLLQDTELAKKYITFTDHSEESTELKTKLRDSNFQKQSLVYEPISGCNLSKETTEKKKSNVEYSLPELQKQADVDILLDNIGEAPATTTFEIIKTKSEVLTIIKNNPIKNSTETIPLREENLISSQFADTTEAESQTSTLELVDAKVSNCNIVVKKIKAHKDRLKYETVDAKFIIKETNRLLMKLILNINNNNNFCTCEDTDTISDDGICHCDSTTNSLADDENDDDEETSDEVVPEVLEYVSDEDEEEIEEEIEEEEEDEENEELEDEEEEQDEDLNLA